MQEVSAVYKAYLQSLHPQIKDEPNHTLILEPAQEAHLRAQAEEAGVDFDGLKHDWKLMYQIVSPGKTHEETMRLRSIHAVPLDEAQEAFSSFISGAIFRRKLPKQQT